MTLEDIKSLCRNFPCQDFASGWLLYSFFKIFFKISTKPFSFWQRYHNKILFAQPWSIPQLAYSTFKRDNFTFSCIIDNVFLCHHVEDVPRLRRILGVRSFHTGRLLQICTILRREGLSVAFLNKIKALLRFSNETELKKKNKTFFY